MVTIISVLDLLISYEYSKEGEKSPSLFFFCKNYINSLYIMLTQINIMCNNKQKKNKGEKYGY